jgi:hypothetical protein
MNTFEVDRQYFGACSLPWLFFCDVMRTKNLKGQRFENIGCEETEKARELMVVIPISIVHLLDVLK